MRRYLSLFLVLIFFNCSTFIIEEEQGRVKKMEEKVYLLSKDVEAGGIKLMKNDKIKVIINIGSEWVKVYGYDSKIDPLDAKRVLISDLYLFESDFPDEQFNYDIFKKKFDKILKETN